MQKKNKKTILTGKHLTGAKVGGASLVALERYAGHVSE